VTVRILVTGAHGFVGGHLLELLRAEHPDVEAFALVRPRGGAPGPRPGGATVLEADIDDAAAVASAVAIARPDRIVHLAGQSSVHHSWIDPGATLRTNVMGVVHLMEAVRAASLRPRVLVVGSADEYGIVEGTGPVAEDTPLRPVSPYAVSKVAQGQLAMEYAVPGGAEVLRTRTFPHTGPGRGEGFAESSFARQLVEVAAGRRAPVLSVGNLDVVRDFSDVRDVVRAYWLLLERGACAPRPATVYNVCSGRGVRLGDLLRRLIALAGVEVEVRQDPGRIRPADIPVLVGDNARLRAATGWEPRIALDQTLRDLLEDWRARTGAAAGSVRE
jgi:GDP-4-dehydro-6-deoxy-D-mannose reductase